MEEREAPSALGHESPREAGRALRVGIVGTGFIGRVHARSARLAGARISGVAASTRERAALAAAELDAERAFADAEELIAADGIDVVHICTPNHLHLPLAIAALEAGKHVVVREAPGPRRRGRR